MKYIIIFICLSIACSKPTEKKLIEAVEISEKSEIESHGQKIESLNIDSLTYELVPLGYYFAYKGISMDKGRFAIAKLNMVMGRKDIEQMQKENRQFNLLRRKVDSMEKNSDTTIKIYKVDYKLNAKTDKNSYSNNETKYFYAKDLSEVKIDIRKS